MRNISFIFFLALGLTTTFAAVETGTSAPEVFLRIVRNNHSLNTWGIMTGTVEHIRKDQESSETPIRLDIRFAADRVIAKVTLDNKSGFTIGQVYDSASASVLQNDKSGDAAQSLGNIGLKPEDLTMSFLHWKFAKELGKAAIMNLNCRVFDLESPDAKEKAIVYISSKHFVAMKAEFVKPGQSEPYRTLVAASFEKSGGLWTVSSFIISGPGWKTKVSFNSVKLGFVKDGTPKELFN